MPINQNISFRSHLLGSVHDFVSSTDMEPLVRAEYLVELVVTLGQYKEEGRDYSPEVYICDDVSKALRPLPNNLVVQIGTVPLTTSSFREILKKCAPLAIEGWCIYIGKEGGQIAYGVFRDQPNPLAVSVSEALISGDSGQERLVRIHQNAVNCVELSNYKKDKHTIFLSHKPVTDPSPLIHIDDLTNAICSDLSSGLREPTQNFMLRTLGTALEASHGALLAVCPAMPPFLSDGSVLSTPIDFASLVKLAIEEKNEEAKLSLFSNGSLMKGMLGCDGIVVFDQKSRLLGYNCFIQPTISSAEISRTGGARRRAFEALAAKLGLGVYATFMRSQDGASQFTRV